VTRFLGDRRLVTLLRVALGALFIAAALPKLADPEGFARAVSHYHMLPVEAERSLALVLPWVELLAGALLLAGAFDAGASLVIVVLMVVFTVAVGSAVGRGLDITCGCFDTEGGTKAGWGKIGENVLFTAAAFWVWRQDRSWLSLGRWMRRTGDIE
jgi:uncharacterized membrane protein YphA (DoxX/SURF4 family)